MSQGIRSSSVWEFIGDDKMACSLRFQLPDVNVPSGFSTMHAAFLNPICATVP